ncbi:hypothetical protein D9Q98_006575 [Chlorella vulgaris]|uniref:Uncharacterized protein n=1 Tax=Chlorella vulgaris TaxID=3077 RepID=A0A9D4TKN9_CHLVU|nr:hypothetical protein D9Q98_006575 [Chlorella vulgaris]
MAPDWSCLPSDIVVVVETSLSSQGNSDHVAAMRATCCAWRQAMEAAAGTELQPLGKPPHLAAFPRAATLDYAARGAGHSLCEQELEVACALLGGRLEALDIGSAFQLTSHAMQRTLRSCLALRHLAADGSTLQDSAFSCGPVHPAAGSSAAGSSSHSVSMLDAPLHSSPAAAMCAPLRRLETLSLRGCLFLRGCLLADLAQACPALASLNLADCALALNLNPEVAALLPRLRSLDRLVLDGNGVDDAAMRHIAVLTLLRELSVRSSIELTDAGLHHLGRLRGGTLPAVQRASGSTRGSTADAERSGAALDAGLAALDISGCTALTDQSWLAIAEMQGLTSLMLEHMPHLLQFPAMPEGLPAALWRLPRLRTLSLAGSCCHPSKLKLLAASCGSSVTHLDIGTGARGGACGVGSGCTSCTPCRCVEEARAASGGQGYVAAGPAYRRLSSLHERDLCEAAASFRQLRSLSGAGSALPLRCVCAFLAATPAGRMQRLDLSGCCLDAEPSAAAAAHSHQPHWQQQLFSSGARRVLNFSNFDSYPSTSGTSATRLHQLHAETDSWQRPATAARFAALLRRQAPTLRCLRLGGASGVTDAHLSSLRCLSALEWLCLAGSRTAVSPTLLAEVASGCPLLQQLDISHTAADDDCFTAIAALPALRLLAASGCARVGGGGVHALAAGRTAGTLRKLDLCLTGTNDEAADALAAGCQQLRGLQLTGCGKLSPRGAEVLGQLERLESLSLGRCPHAVTDASLLLLASKLPLLTRLCLSEAQQLTAGGLAAALPLLPCLAHLDLTCCWQLHDDELLDVLGSNSTASSTAAAADALQAPGGWVTPATVQLPKGGSSPTGSPFRRRMPAGAAA